MWAVISASTKTIESSGYYALLCRNVSIRRLLIAQIVSELGDWFNLVALMQRIAHHSTQAEMVGLLLIIQTVPFIVLSPLAGYLADRWDRRRLMIFADLCRAVIVLGFIFIPDTSWFWLLYVLAALQFSLTSLFEPARSALIANLASDKELIDANALSSSVWSIMLTVGSALGGLVVSIFPLVTAFLIDSASFLISAFFLYRIQVLRNVSIQRKEAEGRSATLEREEEYAGWIRPLFQLFKQTPQLLKITFIKTGIALTSGAAWLLASVFGQRTFPLGKGGALSLGILYSTMGLGAIIGTFFARQFFTVKRNSLKSIFWLYLSRSFILCLTGLFHHLAGVAVTYLVFMASSGLLWTLSSTLLQQRTPDRLRGRIFAFENALQTLAFVATLQMSGWLCDQGFSPSQVAVGISLLALGIAFGWKLLIRNDEKIG